MNDIFKMTDKDIIRLLKKEMHAPEDIDVQMIKESVKNYSRIEYKGAYCLDLGANIGAFAVLAAKFGAKKVLCVECDPRNIEILKKNVAPYPQIEVLEGAVVPDNFESDPVIQKPGMIHIFKSNAKSNHSSTSINKRTRNFKVFAQVKAIKIGSLLKKHEWDVLKMDIEGAEVDCIDIEDVNFTEIPHKFIEFHVNKNNKDKVSKLREFLRNDSDEADEKPVVYFASVNGYDCYYAIYEETC